MKFGAVLPLASGGSAGEIVDLGVRAEELGYESVWVQDDPTSRAHDAVTILAALAARTRRVRLGFSIMVLPQRETAATARALATIDAIAGGRLVVGVGVGSARRPPLVYDVETKDRGRLIDEQVEAMRRLWTGDTVEFEGRWVRLQGVRSPPPANPDPPIWIGTWGNEGGLRRVVRIGKGWFASGISTKMERFATSSRRLDDLCTEAGRDPTSIERAYTNCPLAIADSREAAIEMAAPTLNGYGLHPLEAGVPLVGTPAEVRATLERAAVLTPDLLCVFPVRPDSSMLQRFRDEVAGSF